MAALSITAASVAWVSGPKDDGQIAGEAFVAGAVVFQSSTNGRWYKAQADGVGGDSGTAVDAAGATGYGLALFTADAAGARGSIARPGSVVTIGAGTAGVMYFIHTTAGSMGPYADLGSTNKVTACAVGIGSNQVLLVQAYHAGSVIA